MHLTLMTAYFPEGETEAQGRWWFASKEVWRNSNLDPSDSKAELFLPNLKDNECQQLAKILECQSLGSIVEISWPIKFRAKSLKRHTWALYDKEPNPE